MKKIQITSGGDFLTHTVHRVLKFADVYDH